MQVKGKIQNWDETPERTKVSPEKQFGPPFFYFLFLCPVFILTLTFDVIPSNPTTPVWWELGPSSLSNVQCTLDLCHGGHAVLSMSSCKK